MAVVRLRPDPAQVFAATQYGHESSASACRLAGQEGRIRSHGMVKGSQPRSGRRADQARNAAAAMSTRFLAVATVLGLGLALGSCGAFVSDRWPHWAGGLPSDAPPRQGAPGYDEFIAHRPVNKDAATPEATAGQSNAPAAPPGNRAPDDQSAVQGGLY